MSMSNNSQTSNNLDLRLDRIEKLVIGAINGQSAMKSELIKKIDDVHKEVVKVRTELTELKVETKKNFEKINDRTDNIGNTVAVFDEDAPTGEEFTALKTRVDKIEQKMVFA